MRFAGLTRLGRIATYLATWSAPPHYQRIRLAYFNSSGYVSPRATIYHSELEIGHNVFIDDDCLIYQREDGGRTTLGNAVAVYRGTIIENGNKGQISIGAGSSIHPRCSIISYLSPIHIGTGVMIAANCAIYSYDHNVLPDLPISKQPLVSRGAVSIDDEAWIGTGVIILSGVTIGKGAVVGAGSVVTHDVPDGAIAVGNPARVIRMRRKLAVPVPPNP
jgi:acetyltransferase-like isoleucine patch superfamily enzyme